MMKWLFKFTIVEYMNELRGNTKCITRFCCKFDLYEQKQNLLNNMKVKTPWIIWYSFLSWFGIFKQRAIRITHT